MTEIDTELRELLRPEVERARAEAPPYEMLVRRAVRRRQRRRVAVGSIMAAVLIGGALALTGDGADEKELDTVGPGSTTTSSPLPGDAISEAPPFPLEVRGEAAVAWTGEELVVWGGHVEAVNMGLPGEDRTYADGAAYDPDTGAWRELAPSPLPSNAAPPRAVMTPQGLAIVRGTRAALWHPDDNEWEELPRADRAMLDLYADGDVLVSVSGQAQLDLSEDEQWQDIPPLPEPLERPASAWFGDGLLTIGGPGGAFTQAAAFRFDLDAGSWRATSPVPDGLRAEALAADWDGGRIVVANYDMHAATYDPVADEWHTLADVPARFSEWIPSVTGSDGVSLVGMAAALVVLSPDDRWIPLPYGELPYGEYLHADVDGSPGRLIVWSIDPEAMRNRLVVTDIDQLTSGPASLQVGLAGLRLPQGYRLSDARLVDEANVQVDLIGPSGACRATGAYTTTAPADLSIEEELHNDGQATPWSRSPDGRRWLHRLFNGSDSLAIECDDATTARQLAEDASLPVT